MTKLIDQVGTKYLAAHFAGDVRRILLKEGLEELDVAGTRICFDVMKQLQSGAYKGDVRIIDSEDPKRNAFFEENRKRGELYRYYQSIQKPIYLPESVEMVMHRISELKPDVVYEIQNAASKEWCAYTFLIQALRPEIQLRVSAGIDELFPAIYDHLDFARYTWDEFYVLRDLTFVVEKPDQQDYDTFVRSNVVVPTVFGSEPLQDKEEWQACLEYMSKILVTYLDPPRRRMIDFLDLGGL